MNKRPSGSTGIASIVLIFVMLCFMTFAVLSLMTARADLAQSQRIADRIQTCNDGENTASAILCTIIQCVNDHLDASDEDEFFSAVQNDLEGKDGITFSGPSTLSYTTEQTPDQILYITLELSLDAFPDGRHYQILSWKSQTTREWTPDTSLPVYDPSRP